QEQSQSRLRAGSPSNWRKARHWRWHLSPGAPPVLHHTAPIAPEQSPVAATLATEPVNVRCADAHRSGRGFLHRPFLNLMIGLQLASFCRETAELRGPIQVMPTDWAQSDGECRDRQACNGDFFGAVRSCAPFVSLGCAEPWPF